MAEEEEDDDVGAEEDMWSGGKTIPVLALRPPKTSSPAEGLDHCPPPPAVPGRDDPLVPTMAYCSRPRPALEEGRLPEVPLGLPDEVGRRDPKRPEEEDGRRPLEY